MRVIRIMIKVELDHVNTATPSEGWRRYYQDQWNDLHKKIAVMIESIGPKNTFQIVKWIERQSHEEGSNPIAEAGHRFPGGRPMMRDSSFRGSAYIMPHFSGAGITETISDFIHKFGPFDAVVEIGSGWGRNLFEIFYNSGWPGPYFGGEITSSGQDLAAYLTLMADGMQASFHPYDHENPDISFIGDKQKVLIFSVHSIEQVKYIPEDFFDRLCAFAPEMTGLHIEPFGFQSKILGKISEIQRDLNKERGWNLNFFDTLCASERRKILDVNCVAEEIFCSEDATNPSSLAMWTKKAFR